MLGISDATVHRRLKDFNLQIFHSFSTVDDNTLDGIVRSIKEKFPNRGYRVVCGDLKGRGLVIQQIRVRETGAPNESVPHIICSPEESCWLAKIQVFR